jgi:hypothetical protein
MAVDIEPGLWTLLSVSEELHDFGEGPMTR